MPIQFSQTTSQGVTVEYNVITAPLAYDPQLNNTSVRLALYVNKESFDNGFLPFRGQGFTFDGQVSVSDAENLIIVRQEWSGAIIVE